MATSIQKDIGEVAELMATAAQLMERAALLQSALSQPPGLPDAAAAAAPPAVVHVQQTAEAASSEEPSIHEPAQVCVQENGDEGHGEKQVIEERVEAPAPALLIQAPQLLPWECVVKVFCKHTKPNFSLPWQKKRQQSSTSSGFVISGRRLLTSAHCVKDHTQVEVKKRSSDTKFLATVLAIGKECDLALLTVDNDQFWEGLVSPIEFGDLPNLQDAVTVVGYPMGGDCMSVTKGVVSRVEVTSYPDGSRLLVVQIDAAINSGNSGGPAFNDKGQSVGVAFLKCKNSDNIGYIIPTPVIKHFINDYELNGEYTGFPTLGICYQRLENPDLRNALCMAPHLKGILIRDVAPTSPVAEFLQPSDILLSFDAVDVANDGTVPFRNGERIHYSYLVSAKYNGEQASIKILRNSVTKSFDIKLHAHKSLVPKHTEPSYYIIGGIVFTFVSEPYLHSEFGKNFLQSAPAYLIKKYLHSSARTKEDELVIVSQILAADINADYEDYSNYQVISFNGTLIKSLKQLVHLVETCKEPFLRFGLQDKYMLVLDTKRAQEATPKILKTHCIPSAMSQDIQAMCEAQD